ncbi:MAG: response regulator transcription factor [Clostridia bacterium]|nr:response regulator transcription factor [Clostridia bacterium]
MPLKIAVCDDSAADRKYMLDLVSRWASDNSHSVSLREFSSAESFLFSWEEDKTIDILLLDIEMAETDGVELARTLRRDGAEMQIIFTTGYSEYILDGYEVAALHYLLKPVREEKIFPVLDRALNVIEKNDRFLTLETPESTLRLAFKDIFRLEVRANYVTVHSVRGEVTVKRTLSEIEALLDERFFRVGRSHIINLNSIIKVTKTEVYLSSGDSVPLSRGVYEPLNRAIIKLN